MQTYIHAALTDLPLLTVTCSEDVEGKRFDFSLCAEDKAESLGGQTRCPRSRGFLWWKLALTCGWSIRLPFTLVSSASSQLHGTQQQRGKREARSSSLQGPDIGPRSDMFGQIPAEPFARLPMSTYFPSVTTHGPLMTISGSNLGKGFLYTASIRWGGRGSKSTGSEPSRTRALHGVEEGAVGVVGVGKNRHSPSL